LGKFLGNLISLSLGFCVPQLKFSQDFKTGKKKKILKITVRQYVLVKFIIVSKMWFIWKANLKCYF